MSARAVRLPNGKSRPMPGDGITITSGSNSGAIDVAQWLDATRLGHSSGGGIARAVAGGVQTAAVMPDPERTVALSDGTRITFAPARTPQELEPA
jgi:hypothetical protein